MVRNLAFALLLGFSCLAAQARQAGRIDLMEGSVSIVDAKDKPRSANVGETVRQGDTITTGRDGEVHMTLDDGSVVAVRPDARMTLVRFQNKGRDTDSSVISLARGALRAITGWIGRRNPNSVRILTPTATIGIRGTDHEALVIPPGSDLGETGTYDKVNAGGTSIRSEHGSVDVDRGQAGFAPMAAAPVILPSVPAFFRPTRNEGRLEGLHDALQRAPAERRASAGGTQIQGNTRINASAREASAVAVGQGNQASNRVGTIGGD
ncbi:MAG: FecR domain-containing protein [Candidatus Nitricoxidivorans perseverans]|uniref:FecR domain-containing protein n=1 Tax=Candidatus Nitricoxidivorans perseverans TaxID=2975601 RepID=A0AA49FME6_9PROT|nr:MAG: FecR domain-containing protein [Candidatus Nitricoxidivorans perseverans]